MKYFLILLTGLMTTEVSARDCLLEAHNFNLGLKFTHKLNHLIEVYRGREKYVQELCETPDEVRMWADEMRIMEEGFAEKRKLLEKRDSIPYNHVFFNSRPGLRISETQICTELDKIIKEEVSCYQPLNYLKELKNTKFSSQTFDKLCLEMFQRNYKTYKSCR